MNYREALRWPPQPPVPYIDRDDLETVYSFGHYDGVGSGLIQWLDCYWFVERWSISSDSYWIVRLTPEQQAYACWYGEEWARLFHSGMSWTPDGNRVPQKDGIHAIRTGNLLTLEEPAYGEFHKKYLRPKPDDNAEVIGYFDHW